MEMRIDSDKVKALRARKLWSQEELATACGVSLRTIQRLEAEGQTSADTIKALAAVFEIDYQNLLIDGRRFTVYQNIQVGFVTVLILVATVMFASLLLSAGYLPQVAYYVVLSGSAIIGLLFFKLTTRVDESDFEWSFNFGFLRKSVPVNEIISYKAVRNKAWWGLGFRLTPHGNLYCVSGLDAIQIKLLDGRKYRIGTDEPQELIRAIEQAQISNPPG